MENIDIELYVSQVIKFFDNNPDELIKLIGNLDKIAFYDNIKIIAKSNFNECGDATLTQKQMIDIVVDMFNAAKQKIEESMFDKIFTDSKYGKICLN
jgi:hypothetical protein